MDLHTSPGKESIVGGSNHPQDCCTAIKMDTPRTSRQRTAGSINDLQVTDQYSCREKTRRITSNAASSITETKVAFKSDFDVSFRAVVISLRDAAYFFRAVSICEGFLVTFDSPAKPTELTALKYNLLMSRSGQSGGDGRSIARPFVMAVT